MLPAPAGAIWLHEQTGLKLPPELAGYRRGEITDSGDAELDVMAQYHNDDRTFVTLYVFRPAIASAAMWFDRSETMILLRDIFGNPVATSAATPFGLPSSPIASGLRRSYLPGKAPYKSTGVAVMPFRDWLVVVRITSADLDAATLDAKLGETMSGIGWPDRLGSAPAASMIAPCDKPLNFDRRAKAKKPDMMDMLMASGLAAASQDKAAEAPDPGPAAAYCREGNGTIDRSVYRAADGGNAYVIAVADAGVSISVDPSIAALTGKGGYSVSLGLPDRTLIFPDFDRLPDPDKVIAVVNSTAPMTEVSRGKKDVTIAVSK